MENHYYEKYFHLHVNVSNEYTWLDPLARDSHKSQTKLASQVTINGNSAQANRKLQGFFFFF